MTTSLNGSAPGRAIDNLPDALDTGAVAQRLRMYMGDKKLSRNKLSLASGITRTALSTKLDGKVEFTLAEIMQLADALGRSWLWILTGVEPSPHPRNGDGMPAPIPMHDPDESVQSVNGRLPRVGLWIRSSQDAGTLAA